MSKWEAADIQGKVQMIKAAWRPGIGAKQLAAEVSRIAGATVTKYSILGLYFRLRQRSKKDGGPNPLEAYPLPQKPTPKKKPKLVGSRSKTRKEKIAEMRALMLDPNPVYELAPDDVPSIHVPLIDLGFHHCRWPTKKEGTTWFFCGLAVKPGQSYCPDHYARSTGAGGLQLTAQPEKVAV